MNALLRRNAREFPAQVITTAEWLSNRSIDISLIEVQAWRVGEQVAVTFDQVYPVAGVGDALLIPARRRVAQSQKIVAETTRAASATKVILEKGLLDNGTLLTWQPTTTIGPKLRQAAAAWVAGNPARGQAVWRTEGGKPLEWLVDGKRYSPSGLVGRILKESAGVQPAVQGTKWWVTEDGVDLATLAYGTTLRDWSDLHQLIATIRPGEWNLPKRKAASLGLCFRGPRRTRSPRSC